MTTILRTLGDVATLRESDGGPLILGAGKRMFSDTDKDKQMLELVESGSYANGIQKLIYEVQR